MGDFKDFLKKIRGESDLTQEELAKVLGVSTILISLLEIGRKEASKAFILKLAEKLEVSPSSITPFLFSEDKRTDGSRLSKIEKNLLELGEELQIFLIKKRASNLKKYV